ncbi:MAG: chaperonin GroEL [Candidatus Paceibacterota bacterium]
MSKLIRYNEEARRALKRGVDKVANAVKVTIGPRGRNVVLDKGFGGPTITNDGVSIAKEIELKDRFENMGAEIIKEVAEKTNTIAGDGTSTATILMQALVEEGMKRTIMGANAMSIREGIERGASEAVEELKSQAKQIKSDEEIQQVATISSESKELGRIIADTIQKVGKDGVVTVEESQSLGLDYDVVEGLQIDKGYISPYMVTNSERMEAEYKEPQILVTDQKISSVKDILPLIEGLAQAGKKDLVIVADDVEGEALATFVVNKLRGGFNVLAVKAPGFGDRKKAMLSDIATVVGAQVVSEDMGMKLENIGSDVLGAADKVVATKDITTFIGGKGRKKDIEARVDQMRRQLEVSDSKFDREKLEERIAKLTGGVAVIRVGAATETEMKYLKLKIEDAVNATKAAIEEGIVPGGGVAFVNVAEKLRRGADRIQVSDDVRIGYKILIRALDAPFRQIVLNSGNEEVGAVLEKVRSGKGYDAMEDEVIADNVKVGILDPVKVARSGIQNAASAAAILLTTEAAVADDPDEKDDDNGGGGPAGGGMPGMGGMGGF